jgi:hypothetical protein
VAPFFGATGRSIAFSLSKGENHPNCTRECIFNLRWKYAPENHQKEPKIKEDGGTN